MKTNKVPDEISIRSLILPVYIPTLLVMFGYGMIIPVLPLFVRSLGAGLGITGVIVSMRGAGSLLFDLPAGAIISRVGKLPALILSLAVAVVVAAATGLVRRLVPLALLTIAMGSAHVLWMISIQTHIRQNLPSHRRGRAMSLVGGTSRVGWVLGPVTGGYIGKLLGLQTVYFGQAMLCFAALIVLLIGSSHYRSRTGEQKGESFQAPGVPFLRTVQGNWRAFLLVGLVVITLQLLRSGRQTLLPLWGEHIGLDVAAIGLIFGLSRAIELALFYPAGVLMDRLGRKWARVPCILLISVGLALIPTAGGFLGLLMVSLIAGIGNGLGSGIVMTLGADLSPRSSAGEFLGMWHLMSDLGALSGPLLIGAVAHVLGLFAAPIAVALFGLLGAWVMVFRVAETLARKRTNT
jgi:MFS family permease